MGPLLYQALVGNGDCQRSLSLCETLHTFFQFGQKILLYCYHSSGLPYHIPSRWSKWMLSVSTCICNSFHSGVIAVSGSVIKTKKVIQSHSGQKQKEKFQNVGVTYFQYLYSTRYINLLFYYSLFPVYTIIHDEHQSIVKKSLSSSS